MSWAQFGFSPPPPPPHTPVSPQTQLAAFLTLPRYISRTHPPLCKSETRNVQMTTDVDDDRSRQLAMPKAHSNDIFCSDPNQSQSITENCPLNIKLLCIANCVWLVASSKQWQNLDSQIDTHSPSLKEADTSELSPLSTSCLESSKPVRFSFIKQTNKQTHKMKVYSFVGMLCPLVPTFKIRLSS
jgi:hypothetical protein